MPPVFPSPPRFHVPPQAWAEGALALSEDESRHCVSVMRRGPGDVIHVFDGAGGWAEARITDAAAKRVELEAGPGQQTPPPAVSISLLQAVPKGANMELIIEKAVELGVNAVHPVLTERTVVKLDAREAERKQAKWQRTALEACKQCGQNWLPEIHAPVTFATFWAQPPAHDLRIIAAIQDDARPLKAILDADRARRSGVPGRVLMVIGPEGDFTPAEYALAREHGCLPMSLGPIILRVETAAMFSLSVLNHELRVDEDTP